MAIATQAFYALRRLFNTKHGLTTTSARQLYTTTVIPVIDFGAEIWWRAERQTSMINKLQVLQNIALRDILGSYRTSPTAAMEAEAAIAPVALRLTHLQRKHALRILALPPPSHAER